jgi:hypothetical protein
MRKGRSKVVRPSAKHVPLVPATLEHRLLPLVGRLAGLLGRGPSEVGSAHPLPPRPHLRGGPSSRWSPTSPSAT